MAGIMRNGQAYASQATIDDKVVSDDKTWSSEKISKINIKDAKKVDSKPVCTPNGDGTYTITYIKDTVTNTTTDDNQWFYYLVNEVLYQTIFIEGEELTIQSSGAEFDEYVKKNSITDTVDSKSTNSQVPGAKFIYDNAIKNKNLKTYTSLSQLGLESGCKTYDIFSAMPENSYIEIGCNESQSGNLVNISDIPVVYGLLTIRKWDKTRFAIELKMSGGGTLAPNTLYIGQLKGNDGSNLTWKRVCMTSVEDVAKTDIILSYPKAVKNNTSVINYTVKNGVCTINYDLSFTATSGIEWTVIATGLPKPNEDVKRTTPAHNGKDSPLILNVNSGCCLVMYMIGATVTTNPHFIDSISYAIAES